MQMLRSVSLIALAALVAGGLTSMCLVTSGRADPTTGAPGAAQPLVLTIQNHEFHPAELHIPAHQSAVIVVKNRDSTAEEFESGALKIEKVIAPGSEGKVHVRASEHGHYTFVGEYHEKTARGVLIVD